MEKSPKRIFILGSIGSGKSTVALRLSEILKIKHYDLDDIFWTKKFNKKRDEKERDKLFRKICNKRRWIIEGVYVTWIEEGIRKSEMVILLDLPFSTLFARITKRTLKREKSKRKGKERYDENWKDYLGLIRAARNYRKKGYMLGYYRHKEMVAKHKVDLVIIRNKNQINKFLEDISHKKKIMDGK